MDDDFELTEGDYVLYDSGPLLSRTSVAVHGEHFLGEFPSHTAAIRAIDADMKRHQFRPNVWYRDDHGGLDLLTMQEELKRLD